MFTARYGLSVYMLFRSILSYSYPPNVRTPSRNEPLMVVTKPDALHRPLPSAPISLLALKSCKCCKSKCHPLRFFYSRHTNALHMPHTAQFKFKLLFKWRHAKRHTLSPNPLPVCQHPVSHVYFSALHIHETCSVEVSWNLKQMFYSRLWIRILQV